MECKEQMKVSEEKLILMEAQLSAGEERVTSLESKLSDSSKDITWYKTQAKSFSKANEELQMKMVSMEDNARSSPAREGAKVDDDVTIVDMDVVSDEEMEEEEVKVDDNSDDSQPSTSKQRSETSQPRNCQDEKDKKESSTRTKRSRSRSPMEQSRKHMRLEPTSEGERRQPIFGVGSPGSWSRIGTKKGQQWDKMGFYVGDRHH